MIITQEKLVSYFICPKCKSDELCLDETANSVCCESCNRVFSVVDQIPIFTVEESLPENINKQIEYFSKADENAPVEHQVYAWQEKYIREFSEELPESPNVILDNGTGSGYMTLALAKICKTVISCDLTLQSLQVLKAKIENGGGYDNILLCCCSSDNLPFKTSLFDGICMNAVIEHIPDEKSAISELGRTICENGVLMIVAPLKYRFLNPLLVPLNMIFDRMIGHLRRYDERSIKNAFGEFFELSKIWYTGHTMKVIKVIINNLKPVFNENEIEVEDNKKAAKKWFASNVVAILRRNFQSIS